jgi:hypothetical protein
VPWRSHMNGAAVVGSGCGNSGWNEVSETSGSREASEASDVLELSEAHGARFDWEPCAIWTLARVGPIRNQQRFTGSG